MSFVDTCLSPAASPYTPKSPIRAGRCSASRWIHTLSTSMRPPASPGATTAARPRSPPRRCTRWSAPPRCRRRTARARRCGCCARTTGARGVPHPVSWTSSMAMSWRNRATASSRSRPFASMSERRMRRARRPARNRVPASRLGEGSGPALARSGGKHAYSSGSASPRAMPAGSRLIAKALRRSARLRRRGRPAMRSSQDRRRARPRQDAESSPEVSRSSEAHGRRSAKRPRRHAGSQLPRRTRQLLLRSPRLWPPLRASIDATRLWRQTANAACRVRQPGPVGVRLRDERPGNADRLQAARPVTASRDETVAVRCSWRLTHRAPASSGSASRHVPRSGSAAYSGST